MFFTSAKDFRERELMPGVQARIAWGERLMLSHATIKPRTHAPAHRHHHEQMGLILEGQVKFTIGTETAILKKGDVFLVPANMEHSVSSDDRGAVVLDVFSPPREEYK